jgi:hypothetical protein
MKTQAFSPSKATIPSSGDNGGFVLASRPSTHRLLTHLPWDGVQPAAHKLSQMNTQAIRSSEAPSPSIRHDNVFTSHPCPRKPKSQRKHEQFDHPMSSPFLGNAAHGVGHHHPKAVVAAPMGGPRSTSRPLTCNAHKNNI